MKIAHLSHLGPRSHIIINQGLLDLNLNFDIDKDYYSKGTLIKKYEKDIIKNLKNYDLIIAGDVVYRDIFAQLNLWKKVVWYDFEDTPTVQKDFLKCRAYFKRNIFNKERNAICQDNIIPIDYCAMNEFYAYEKMEKIFDISCFFGLTGDKRRDNLVNILIKNGVKCEATASGSYGRNSLDKKNCQEYDLYLKKMKQSKIIFTAFPQNHDGDSRTWEAFSSGSLVFRDRTFIKSKYPLENENHFFEYDANNINSIELAFKKANLLLSDAKLLNKVASNGYNHVKNNHKAKNRVQFILSNSILKL